MAAGVTIYDVARAAKVSPRSVSRFFNHPEMLAQATREGIARQVERLAFRPSTIANRLSQGELDSVAVFAHVASGSLGELHRLLLGHLADGFAQLGRDLLLVGLGAVDTERIAATHIRPRKLAAALLLTAVGDGLERAFAEAGIRTVSINWRSGIPGCRYIGIDYRASAEAYASTLLERCRPARRLVYVGPEDARADGVLAAAIRHGMPHEHLRCTLDDWCDAGRVGPLARAVAAAAAGGGPPPLLVCWSDHLALRLLAAVQRLGLRVPEDLRLAGFDGLEAGTLLHPTLTTAVQPWREMATAAVAALLQPGAGDCILPVTPRWGGTTGTP